MEYKYENVENVEVKQDFNIYKLDDDGDVIETIVLKRGTKGVIESMGWSSTYGFRNCYDILFTEEDGNEIAVGVYEEKMEEDSRNKNVHFCYTISSLKTGTVQMLSCTKSTRERNSCYQAGSFLFH